MNPPDPTVPSINVGYFYRLFYDLFITGHAPTAHGLVDFAATTWFWLSLIAYLVTLLMIGAIVYYQIRLHQVTEEVDRLYATVPEPQAHAAVEHARWKRIRELIESPMESDWRSAIIEADIMLDEMLSRIGYMGNTVGDKLKMANETHFQTLRDAWEAHAVRNEIAHQGTAYQLSPNVAYRTIGRYENVFREFHEI